MKTLILAAIRRSLMFTAVATLFVQPAQAFTITLEQMGANVVATGSGAINLTGLTLETTGQDFVALMQASTGLIETAGNGDVYGGFTGPTSFGNGGSFAPNTSSGDFAGIDGAGGNLGVPAGYVSNTALSDSMTFNSATFASLGVTPGTYVWTWGTGLPNQNFKLVIGSVGGPGVPDGGWTVSLLGCALVGLAALRRKLLC